MVSITIFVEGGPSGGASSFATVSALATYREGFRTLFSSLSIPYQLIVEPIGSVSGARKYLEKIDAEGLDGFVLIDLDGPPADRAARIAANYSGVNPANLYFMVQEMEAWILSQPEKVEDFGRNEGWTSKPKVASIVSDPAISGKHPEDIDKPAEVLDTLLRRYFQEVKIRGGKPHVRPVRYHKTAHGPKLLARLDLTSLRSTFSDVEQIALRLT